MYQAACRRAEESSGGPGVSMSEVVMVLMVVMLLALEGQSSPPCRPHTEAIPNHNQVDILTINDSSLLSI